MKRRRKIRSWRKISVLLFWDVCLMKNKKIMEMELRGILECSMFGRK